MRKREWIGIAVCLMGLTINPGLTGGGALAATNTATGASYAAVAAAVAAATDGDTVHIPAGSATWSSTLALTKAIHLAGAGTNATTITVSGREAIHVGLSQNKPVRVSGLAFVNNGGTPTIALASSSVPITAFRVDHCQFVGGTRTLNPEGWCYGVIDHCTFINCNIAVGPVGDNNAAWSRPIQPGTTNCVCIEDNVFIINNSADSEPNEQIYHQEGTRTTIRHNRFDGTGYTAGNSLFLDAHGNQNYIAGGAGDFRGTVLVECYNNTFSAYQTYRMFHLRAGSHLVFSNTFACVQGTPDCFVLTDEESWQTAFFSPLRTAWPAEDQIKNSFFWANILNGAAVTDANFWHDEDLTFIQKGRDYWMMAPGAANGRPAGVYASYRPLVYPHPLVTSQDTPNGGTMASGIPLLSLSAGSLAFDAQIDGPTPAPQMVSVVNVGTTDVLEWSQSDDASWLQVSPASGTTPGSLNVAVSPSGLAAGTYTATVTVEAPDTTNTARSLTVSLVVTAAPQLLVRYNMTYPDRATLLADGWDFLARKVSGTTRNTEQASGAVVSYDQAAHPGVLRIPADSGDLWENYYNDTRNSLFRDLPGTWTSVRMCLDFFSPTMSSQQAGLAVYQDDDNYAQVYRIYEGGHYLGFIREQDQAANVVNFVPQNVTTSIHLRLDRDPAAETITGYYSMDNTNWTSMGSISQTLTNPRLGIIVGASPRGFPSADVVWAEVYGIAAPAPPKPMPPMNLRLVQ